MQISKISLHQTSTGTHFPQWTCENPVYALATVEVERCWPSPVYIQLRLRISEFDAFSNVIIRLFELGFFQNAPAYQEWFNGQDAETLTIRVNRAVNDELDKLMYIIERLHKSTYASIASLMGQSLQAVNEAYEKIGRLLSALPEPEPPKPPLLDKYQLATFYYIMHEYNHMPDGRPLTEDVEGEIEDMFGDDAGFVSRWATEDEDDGPEWLLTQLEEDGLIALREDDIHVNQKGLELWATLTAHDEAALVETPLAGIEVLSLLDIAEAIKAIANEGAKIWKTQAMACISKHTPSLFEGSTRKSVVETVYEVLVERHLIYTDRYGATGLTALGEKSASKGD